MTMRGIRLFSMSFFILSAAIVNAQDNPATANAVDVTAAAPAPVPVYPKRPAEMPPKAPKVTCRGDQITISADNSTLDAILIAVKGCTGAHIDIPGDASRVRSFEELGPGPVREVLDELLSGTPYNFVIQSSESNPLKVESVLLSMRGTDTDKPGTSNSLSKDIEMTPGRRAWQHMQKFDKPDPSQVNDDGTPVAADDVPSPAAENTAASAQSADSGAAAAATHDSAATEAAVTPPVTPVAPPILEPGSDADPAKAVQDRIAQMQQMFNQRQQMIQKQTQSQSGTPNN